MVEDDPNLVFNGIQPRFVSHTPSLQLCHSLGKPRTMEVEMKTFEPGEVILKEGDLTKEAGNCDLDLIKQTDTLDTLRWPPTY